MVPMKGGAAAGRGGIPQPRTASQAEKCPVIGAPSIPGHFCPDATPRPFQRIARSAQTAMLDCTMQSPVLFHVSAPFLRFSREHGSPGAWHSPKSAPAHAAHGH